MSLAVFRANVGKLIRDGAGVLEPQDLDFLIAEAVRRYSRAKPQTLVVDIPGDGTFDYLLPGTWVSDFSQVITIEYPAGQREPVFVDRLDWRIYRSPAVSKLRFLNATPQVGQTIRFTFSAPQAVAEGSTSVPAADFDVINALGAALSCEAIASQYSNIGGGSQIQADQIDQRGKASEYAARAKRFFTLANELCPGLKQDDEVRAAGSETSWGETQGFLTHPER